MGPLFIDLAGTELCEQDRHLLRHPGVGGVILFTHNFKNLTQLAQLTADIRATADRPLLIGVDHEGGRVQRFRHGFTEIPAMGDLVQDLNPVDLAQTCGWLVASELIALGIDLSFGPVLDLDCGSHVINNRSFNPDPKIVIQLATAFIEGMQVAGMACVGKHFPGHGSVAQDTHITTATDLRAWDDISNTDLSVFRHLIFENLLDAIMPAHVTYPVVDLVPASFSHLWLNKVLRQDMGFKGVVISDDLAMAGADMNNDFPTRAKMALDAGCDLLLICHQRQAILDILASLPPDYDCQGAEKLLKKNSFSWQELTNTPLWQSANQRVQTFQLKLNRSKESALPKRYVK